MRAVSAEAPFVSKRTVPSTESAVNFCIAFPESVTVPIPISVRFLSSFAIPDRVATPRPVYAGVKSISGCVSSPDIVNVPDGTKSWNTCKYLVSATPLISVRIALAADGSTVASAAESITIPSAARAILTDITGAAETRYLQVFQDFIPSGTLTLSGELTHPDIDFTPAYTGLGVATLSGTALQKFVAQDITSGSATLSGSAILKFTADDLEGTVLFDTKGASALTALNQVYGYYGDDRDPGTSGITTISGSSATREIQNYGYYGDDKDPGTSGTFTFSNTPLVHPDIRYIPSIGIGVAVLYQIGGSSTESFSFANYETQGRFKGLASVKESFGRATYVGIGQVNTFGTAQEEYAVFEEPRTYVVII